MHERSARWWATSLRMSMLRSWNVLLEFLLVVTFNDFWVFFAALNPSCWCACWSIPLCLSAMAGLENYRELYQPQLRWYNLSLRYLCIYTNFTDRLSSGNWLCVNIFHLQICIMYAISICITRIHNQYSHGFVAWFVSPFIWEHGCLHISPDKSRPKGSLMDRTTISHQFPSQQQRALLNPLHPLLSPSTKVFLRKSAQITEHRRTVSVSCKELE